MLKSIPNLKLIIIKFILLTINGLCIYYYSSKYSGWALLITLIYSLFSLIFIFFPKEIKYKNWHHIVLLISFICFLFLCIVIFQIYPKENNGNDRWSDIVSFWDTFLNGKNGWSGRSHLGNRISSMPTNLWLSYPFYRLNIIDYFSVFSFISFWIYLYFIKVSDKNKIKYLLFSLICPLVLIEVISRSNLLLNGVIFLLGIDCLFHSLKQNKIKFFYLSGFIFGLTLAYRLAFIMPFSMIFVYLIIKSNINIKQMILFSTIVVLTFIFSFLPFLINHWQDFQTNNPFIKQAKVTITQSIFLLIFSISLVYFIKKKSDVYFLSTIILSISVILGCFQYNRYTTLFYITMTLPLVFKYLIIEKNKLPNSSIN